jgi:hypothetical protein
MYSAFYQNDHRRIIFRECPQDDIELKLPSEATPARDKRNTYFRLDGGDRFEFALFQTPEDGLIVVQRLG